MPFYSDHTAALRAELGEALPRDLLRQFHLKSAWRHMLVGARQFAILGVATWGLVEFEHPAIWIPLAFAQGFTVFNFTGHEVTASWSRDGSWTITRRTRIGIWHN